jgi:hypothetical protein
LIFGGILTGIFGISFLFVKKASARVREAQDKLHVLATIDALTAALTTAVHRCPGPQGNLED